MTAIPLRSCRAQNDNFERCIPILKGKLTLVTGAGSGVGRDAALGLASQGAEVVLVGRRVSKLEETKELITANGGRAVIAAADVGNLEEVKGLAHKVLSNYGIPSMLHNGAGVHGEIKPIVESNPEQWVNTFMINTIGPYLICRAFVGEMVKLGWGRIVNMTSAASLAPPRGVNSAYAASKAALNHFTRQLLAAELMGTGVTANVIHPGEVKTEMWEAIREDSVPSGDMRRWVEWVEQTGGDSPEKSVKLILDLLKPESNSITGRFLWIEDGLKKPMPSWD
ncbi:SDR family NAD(P)-dependent oxidoreductase [Paenibacillus alginolyticus]|uniref:SDR family NAD(P)-dependent oxidoreductase n=1 Tax=Paenibacillus alginolyticus TaxID=59839 RepID=UPI001376F00A|nr:SDR family oxidoreductase [Paenibacillus alginolyticus]